MIHHQFLPCIFFQKIDVTGNNKQHFTVFFVQWKKSDDSSVVDEKTPPLIERKSRELKKTNRVNCSTNLSMLFSINHFLVTLNEWKFHCSFSSFYQWWWWYSVNNNNKQPTNNNNKSFFSLDKILLHNTNIVCF